MFVLDDLSTVGNADEGSDISRDASEEFDDVRSHVDDTPVKDALPQHPVSVGSCLPGAEESVFVKNTAKKTTSGEFQRSSSKELGTVHFIIAVVSLWCGGISLSNHARWYEIEISEMVFPTVCKIEP